MGIGVGIRIEYAGMVDSVYSHFAVGVDYIIIPHNNAHMVYYPIAIIKKSQITGLALFDKTQGFPLARLLFAVPQQIITVYFIYHLGKSGAIYSEDRLASP